MTTGLPACGSAVLTAACDGDGVAIAVVGALAPFRAGARGASAVRQPAAVARATTRIVQTKSTQTESSASFAGAPVAAAIARAYASICRM